jgi:hypothetical protein
MCRTCFVWTWLRSFICSFMVILILLKLDLFLRLLLYARCCRSSATTEHFPRKPSMRLTWHWALIQSLSNETLVTVTWAIRAWHLKIILKPSGKTRYLPLFTGIKQYLPLVFTGMSHHYALFTGIYHWGGIYQYFTVLCVIYQYLPLWW